MHSEEAILHSLECMRKSELPTILMVTHALGGGVERHVQELQSVLKGRAHVVIVRPHVHAQQVLLTAPVYAQVNSLLKMQGVLSLAFKWPEDSTQMREWFALLGVVRMHVHHVLGFAQTFWELVFELQLPFDLTLHDHSIFTGNPSLLDKQGCFAPDWLNEGLTALPAGDIKVAQVFRKLALGASRVIVPSWALAIVVERIFPSLELLVRNHPEREVGGCYPSVKQFKLGAEERLKVLCLGMLGVEKGAYVLAETARIAEQQGFNIEFILLGACHVALPSSVRCMGLYQDAELLELIAVSEPHLLWLPAQCPETWSYTLSAGLRSGLPVLASNLGAIPERLVDRPFTRLLVHTATAHQWLAAMQCLRADLLKEYEVEVFQWHQDDIAPFYTASTDALEERVSAAEASYLLDVAVENFAEERLPLGFFKAQRLASRQVGCWRVLLLKALYAASRWPLLAWLVNRVPYHLQQRLKRAVSRAPLDERLFRK